MCPALVVYAFLVPIHLHEGAVCGMFSLDAERKASFVKRAQGNARLRRPTSTMKSHRSLRWRRREWVVHRRFDEVAGTQLLLALAGHVGANMASLPRSVSSTTAQTVVKV